MAGSIPASPIADTLAPREAKPRHVTPGREAWRRFRRHRMAAISLVVLTLLSILVIFGSLIWRIPIDEIDFTARLQ